MRHKIRIKKREEYARTVKNATSCDVFHEGKNGTQRRSANNVTLE